LKEKFLQLRWNGKQLESKGEEPVVNKPLNSYLFEFLDLQIRKPLPYVGDIWVLTLPIKQNRYVKIFTLGMNSGSSQEISLWGLNMQV
jgi:hypothetical protein